MKIFKIRESKDSYLILDGNRVINGDYDVELKDENVAFYNQGNFSFFADFVCKVPVEIKGGYRDILYWLHTNNPTI